VPSCKQLEPVIACAGLLAPCSYIHVCQPTVLLESVGRLQQQIHVPIRAFELSASSSGVLSQRWHCQAWLVVLTVSAIVTDMLCQLVFGNLHSYRTRINVSRFNN